jgi:hypothetical protein
VRCLEWAPQKILPGQAASPKKNHAELLRDCECVPRRSAESACNELQEFLSCWFWRRAEDHPEQASVKKIVMWSCFVIVNASLEAPDSASPSCRILMALPRSAPQKIYCRARPRHPKKIMRSCFCIVNASLAGEWRQNRLGNELQEFSSGAGSH